LIVRKLYYKKYIKEIYAEKINSKFIGIFYDRYSETLDCREGLILNESHIAYLKGLYDGLEWYSYRDDDIEYAQKEINQLISYIQQHKEVQIWSGFEEQDEED
jgi:hypothetical protein